MLQSPFLVAKRIKIGEVKGYHTYNVPQQLVSVNETFLGKTNFTGKNGHKVQYKLKLISYTGKVIEKEVDGYMTYIPF